MSKLRIALVTPGFPANEDDDTSVPALQIFTRALAETTSKEVEVTVLALHYPKRNDPYRFGEVTVVPINSYLRWPLRAHSLWRTERLLLTLHQREAFDLCHSFWLTDATLAAISAARRIGCPLVTTIMGQDARRDNRYLRLLRLPKDAVVVSPCERTRSTYKASLGDTRTLPTMRVIPWGVEDAVDIPIEHDLGPCDLLGVGSLTENKNFAAFLQVHRKLLDLGHSIRSTLIGDGPQRRSLENLRRELAIEDSFSIVGEQSRARVLAAMTQARILVHPARYEGFGLVFAEALARGMQIVSRPIGAASEGPRWHLYDSDSDLLAALAPLVAAPEDRRPQNDFPLQTTVSQYLELYEELKTGRSS